jgi:hypothetical protein
MTSATSVPTSRCVCTPHRTRRRAAALRLSHISGAAALRAADRDQRNRTKARDRRALGHRQPRARRRPCSARRRAADSDSGIGKKTAERIVLEMKDRSAMCAVPMARAEQRRRRSTARRPRLRAREPGLSSAAGRESCRMRRARATARRLRGRAEEARCGTDAMNEPVHGDRLVPRARRGRRAVRGGTPPATLDEYIGQDRVRDNLQVSIAAARAARKRSITSSCTGRLASARRRSPT